MRIAVLMGGTNLDRDTSLASGTQVAVALRETGHEVAAVDTATPVDGTNDEAFAARGEPDDAPPVRPEPPSDEELAALWAAQDGHVLAPGVLDLCQAADCVFMALFGDEGEGGRVQGLLSHAGVRYTGPELLGCAVSFDKDMAKRLVRPAGVTTADWTTVPRGEPDLDQAEELLPAVVKPVAGGSSIGASVAHSARALARAVVTAHATGQDALVERLMTGREFTVGVLDGEVLPVVELVAGGELIDYTSKYQPGMTDKHCPADLGTEETERVASLAVDTHQQLKLGTRTCSRVDFRMDDHGRFHFLECNPLPGLTPSSFLPVAAGAAGMSLADLCERIVKLSTAPA